MRAHLYNARATMMPPPSDPTENAWSDDRANRARTRTMPTLTCRWTTCGWWSSANCWPGRSAASCWATSAPR